MPAFSFINPLRLAVLRLGFTEPAWTSPLNYGERDGQFTCASCKTPLFDSRAKYDSGSGWPSFWRTVNDGAVGLSKPDFLGRVECHCAKCDGHLGHVFPDGPIRYGLVPPGDTLPSTDFKCRDGASLPRYCINGLALRYRPVR